jgi:hypothetical protein
MTTKRQRAVAKRAKRRDSRERRKSRARGEFNQRVRVGLAGNRLPVELLPTSSSEFCTCGHPFGRHYLKVGWPCCSDCDGCRGYAPHLPRKLNLEGST